MNTTPIVRCCTVATLLALGMASAPKSSNALQRGPPGAEEEMEVLTRGPVHEAFAETVTFDPEPGLVAPKPPPEAIEELPPDQKPDGANVDWIPGYWAWDDERNDFLWVSGLWRALPPGRQWVPGYWGRSAEGVQWTAGYWADAQESEVEYLPEPPATVEEGPSYAAPSADYIWAPGIWLWNQTRYAWQPGYWVIAQPDWTWVPAHYVWSPRGYVFVNGYYDYSVARRGVLFAPVYFTSSIYARSGFSYTPVAAINPGVFTSHLFLRPGYGHYYFGDYYGSNYASRGFSPWFTFYSSRRGYDPFYAHQRWSHRNDRQWHQRVEADFVHRRDHEDARPPRTWTAQRALMTREAGSSQTSFVVAAPIEQLARSKDSPMRFQAVDASERQRLAKHGQEIQRFRQERQKLETRAGASTADRAKQADLAKQAAPARVKLPRSPLLAKSPDELGKDQAPPQLPLAPQPDSRLQPKQRTARSPQQPATARTATPRIKEPVGKLRPQPRVENPARKSQSALKPQAEQPSPKTQTPNRQPQGRAEQATTPPEKALDSRRQPRADQARGKRDARVQQPSPRPRSQAKTASQPQAQPRAERPRPQPQPNVQSQPKTQPQRQLRAEQPKAQPQPQAQARQPAPRPQPQPRVERPKAQPQPQATVQRSTPQLQPKADAPVRPRTGPKQDKPKGKD